MKKASQTNWLANINPNSQTAVCQVRLWGVLFFILSDLIGAIDTVVATLVAYKCGYNLTRSVASKC